MSIKKRTSFSETYILEIARKVNQGFCAFVPFDGGDALFAPDYRNLVEETGDAWKSVLDRLKFDEDDFFEVAPPEGKDVYWQMQLFMQKQASSQAQRVLSDALSTKSPFSSFKIALEQLKMTKEWEVHLFPKVAEHTRGAFNIRQKASMSRIFSYHPEYKDHVD